MKTQRKAKMPVRLNRGTARCVHARVTNTYRRHVREAYKITLYILLGRDIEVYYYCPSHMILRTPCSSVFQEASVAGYEPSLGRMRLCYAFTGLQRNVICIDSSFGGRFYPPPEWWRSGLFSGSGYRHLTSSVMHPERSWRKRCFYGKAHRRCAGDAWQFPFEPLAPPC